MLKTMLLLVLFMPPFLCSCVRMHYPQHIDPSSLLGLSIPSEVTDVTSLIDMGFFDAKRDDHDPNCVSFSIDPNDPSLLYKKMKDLNFKGGSLYVSIYLEPTALDALNRYRNDSKILFERFSETFFLRNQVFENAEKQYIKSYVKRSLADAGFMGYQFRMYSGSSRFLLRNKRFIVFIDEFSDVKDRGAQIVIDQLADSIENNLKRIVHQ